MKTNIDAAAVLREIAKLNPENPDHHAGAVFIAREAIATVGAAIGTTNRGQKQLADWLLRNPLNGADLQFAGPPEEFGVGLSQVKMMDADGNPWTLIAGLREGYKTEAERNKKLLRIVSEELATERAATQPAGEVLVPRSLLEWAQQNIDCREDADERARVSKAIGQYLAAPISEATAPAAVVACDAAAWQQVRYALEVAMGICDAVPTRLQHSDDEQMARIGMLVNVQPDGAHGYAIIRDALKVARAVTPGLLFQVAAPISEASATGNAIARAIFNEERACRAEDALLYLVEQITKTSPVDDHGHKTTMNMAYIKAVELVNDAGIAPRGLLPTQQEAKAEQVGAEQRIASLLCAEPGLTAHRANQLAHMIARFNPEDLGKTEQAGDNIEFEFVPAPTDDPCIIKQYDPAIGPYSRAAPSSEASAVNNVHSAGYVMRSAHSFCPTGMGNIARMQWIAEYFMRNFSIAPAAPFGSIVELPTDPQIRTMAWTAGGFQDDETAVWELTDPCMLKLVREYGNACIAADRAARTPAIVGSIGEDIEFIRALGEHVNRVALGGDTTRSRATFVAHIDTIIQGAGNGR